MKSFPLKRLWQNNGGRLQKYAQIFFLVHIILNTKIIFYQLGAKLYGAHITSGLQKFSDQPDERMNETKVMNSYTQDLDPTYNFCDYGN